MARMPSPVHHDPSRMAQRTGRLAVDGGHVLAWQDRGPLGALPILLLHGGPGSATSPRLMHQAAVDGVRVVGFDQRGCGDSTPAGETRANDTAHLVRDIEALRVHLGIDRWLVTGGSWGATLALAYAASHPRAVRGLLLRNLFVPSPADIGWFFQGAAAQHPQAWERFAATAPAHARGDLLAWLAGVFAAGPRPSQEQAALAWSAWECALAGAAAQSPVEGDALQALVRRYRIQAHYLANACWLGEGGLRAAALAVPDVPVLFVHGAQDMVCRPGSARSLQGLVRGSRLELVACGHDPFSPAMEAAVRGAIEAFAARGSFKRVRVPPLAATGAP